MGGFLFERAQLAVLLAAWSAVAIVVTLLLGKVQSLQAVDVDSFSMRRH